MLSVLNKPNFTITKLLQASQIIKVGDEMPVIYVRFLREVHSRGNKLLIYIGSTKRAHTRQLRRNETASPAS